MPTRDELEIVDLLRSFFAEMGVWEAQCTERRERRLRGELSAEETRKQGVESLKSIFQKYCSFSGLPHRARGGLHYSTIPNYGPDLEVIKDISIIGDKARVLTKQTTDAAFDLVYYLTRTPSGWRIIDDRKVLDHNGIEDDWNL